MNKDEAERGEWWRLGREEREVEMRVYLKKFGPQELDYFSGNESNSKDLTREAGRHRHNPNELARGLIQRSIACSAKSNQLQKINSRSRRITP
jgi:hypothetical protein